MIEHLRQREKALEQFGWTGREAEWIALVCLHSGVFTRAQFCHYFDTDRKRALRFVRALVERRQAVESENLVFSGGGVSRIAWTGPGRSAKASPIGTNPCLRCMAYSPMFPRQDRGPPISGFGELREKDLQVNAAPRLLTWLRLG